MTARTVADGGQAPGRGGPVLRIDAEPSLTSTETVADAVHRILKLILDVASGRLTPSEQQRQRDFATRRAQPSGVVW